MNPFTGLKTSVGGLMLHTELGRFFTVALSRAPESCWMPAGAVEAYWRQLERDAPALSHLMQEASGGGIGREDRASSATALSHGRMEWVPEYEALFGKLPALWFCDHCGRLDQTALDRYQRTGEVWAKWRWNVQPTNAVPGPAATLQAAAV